MNFNQLMKQAQQVQKKLNRVQKDFNEKIFDFANQEQSVKGQMKGNMEIIKLEIADQVWQNTDIPAGEQIAAALNEARNQIAAQKEKELGAIAGDVHIPNLF